MVSLSTRQHKSRQDKTRQDKTRQDKTRQVVILSFFCLLSSCGVFHVFLHISQPYLKPSLTLALMLTIHNRTQALSFRTVSYVVTFPTAITLERGHERFHDVLSIELLTLTLTLTRISLSLPPPLPRPSGLSATTLSDTCPAG